MPLFNLHAGQHQYLELDTRPGWSIDMTSLLPVEGLKAVFKRGADEARKTERDA